MLVSIIMSSKMKHNFLCVPKYWSNSWHVLFWYFNPEYEMSWKTFHHVTGSTQWSDISVLEITFKPRSYPTSIDEETIVVIISSMNFCNFKSCPFDTLSNPIWWLISKPYLHSGFANSFLIYRGHNPKNRSIPIFVYLIFLFADQVFKTYKTVQ